VASAAAIGDAVDARTPLHRSPAALRFVVAAGAEVADFVAALLALRAVRAGVVARTTGLRVACGAVAVAVDVDVVAGAVAVTTRCEPVLLRGVAGFVALVVLGALAGRAPLVEAEADDVVAPALAGADAGAGAD